MTDGRDEKKGGDCSRMYANNAREVGDRKTRKSLLEWLHIRIIHIYTRKLLLASRDSLLGEGFMKDVFMQMLMRIRVVSCVIRYALLFRVIRELIS